MNNDEVTIVVTGDFCPHKRIEELALKYDYKLVFNDFLEVFNGSDVNITDLECPLTDSLKGRPKSGPHQKAKPECITLLTSANIKYAALANNHIMDYDRKGISDTLELCAKNAIRTFGIGQSQEEAAKACSIFVKNKRIAVLNYADNEFITTRDNTYCCNALDPVRVFNDIKLHRKNHDIVIVIVHAGNEFYELPSPRTKKLYRFMADAGADVIIAHHTHAYSGYEIYNSTPIFYGLGNFIYDWPGKINNAWNRGYVVKLKIGIETSFEIIPLKQCDHLPGVFHLNKLETEIFFDNIIRLNQIISDDNHLEKEFSKYCKSVFPMYDAFIEPYFGCLITALRTRGFFPKLVTRRKRILLLNLIRCESHREVLIRLLKQYE